MQTHVLVKHLSCGKVHVYAFHGWAVGSAQSALRRQRLLLRIYQRRFGIETSYRQMNSLKAPTTSKQLEYRLLLVGIALLLRQVWVAVTAQLARIQGRSLDNEIKRLPLARLAEWIAHELELLYKQLFWIDLGPGSFQEVI